uniref:Uncharacterized protein n=1 Tax=Anguilla anguilla TaxID=7936 RepID=A0A0E9RUF4_ANGAN
MQLNLTGDHERLKNASCYKQKEKLRGIYQTENILSRGAPFI